MQIDLATGLLSEARQHPSSNCDVRPAETEIGLIVIHGISLPPGEFGGEYIDQLFCNQLNPSEHPYFAGIAHLKVSSHLLIRRNGEIVQYVSFNQRAWHAGVSNFQGKESCNDFSIGIELEGDDETPYTDIQYRVLSEVTRTLIDSYPGLNQQTIAGHSDIAPGRKTDPGPAFDWEYFHEIISSS
jgi:AmpD protein